MGMEHSLSLECVICQADIAAEADVYPLPCGHRFHEGCITRWLRDHDTCPCCRAKTPARHDPRPSRHGVARTEQPQRAAAPPRSRPAGDGAALGIEAPARSAVAEELQVSGETTGNYWRSLGHRSYEVVDLFEEDLRRSSPDRQRYTYCSLRGDDGATHMCKVEHIYPEDGRDGDSWRAELGHTECIGRRVFCPHSKPRTHLYGVGAVYKRVHTDPCVLYSEDETTSAYTCGKIYHPLLGITHVCDSSSLQLVDANWSLYTCPHSDAPLPTTMAECKAYEEAQRKANTAFENGVVQEYPGERVGREAWRSPGGRDVWVKVPLITAHYRHDYASSEGHRASEPPSQSSQAPRGLAHDYQGVLSAAERIKGSIYICDI